MPRTLIPQARLQASNRMGAMKLFGTRYSSPNVYPCHNGIATDGTYYYTLDTAIIKKYDANWNLVATNNTAAADAGIQHLGDGQVYNGKLYIAAENYSSPVSYGSQRISLFNTSDLTFVENHDISAQGNEVSGLCIDPTVNTIYVCSFVQSGAVYKYDLTTFSYLGSIPFNAPLTQIQGIAYRDGYFYLGDQPNNQVRQFTLKGETTNKIVDVANNGSIEGLDFSTPNLLILDENSNLTTSIIRIVPESYGRTVVSDNMVRNGDFEFSPPTFVAATTKDDAWIDGTANGLSFGDYFNSWATNNGVATSSARYDQSVFHSGTTSMKLSTVASGQSIEVKPYLNDTSYSYRRFAIPVEPFKNYTLTYWMKTNYVSGDSNDGAFMAVVLRNASGTALTTIQGTKVKTTTDWTQYTMTFNAQNGTTPAFIAFPCLRIYGQTGTATLVMDAWFDDIVLKPTVTTNRTLVT